MWYGYYSKYIIYLHTNVFMKLSNMYNEYALPKHTTQPQQWRDISSLKVGAKYVSMFSELTNDKQPVVQPTWHTSTQT